MVEYLTIRDVDFAESLTLEDARRLAVKPSPWRPIETAPRDGTEIDVWEFCHDPDWRPDAHGIQGGWRVTNARWSNNQWEQYYEPAQGWGAVSNMHYTVSHWLPIPKPPQS